MNRRGFTAGVAALIPASGLALEATPKSGGAARETLEVVIKEVIGKGRISILSSLVDNSRAGSEDFFLVMIELATGIRGDAEGPIATTVRMIAAESEQAMALIDIGEESERFAFIYLEVQSGSGLISAANAAWHDY